MAIAEKSTNPQIDQKVPATSQQTEQEKIDHIADDMAAKAGRVQHKDESSTTSRGGVGSGGGGVFIK
jgi:hypothetical protein